MRGAGFRLLDWLVGPHHESLVGDLHLCHLDLRQERGAVWAAVWMAGQLAVTLPRVFWFNLTWEQSMFRNYLLVAARQMRRSWSFSLINVLGLAMSLAVCLVILSLLNDQRGFDTFHPDGDRIYRVTSRVVAPYGTFTMATSAGPLGPELARESPDVEALVQLRRTAGHLAREDGYRVDFRGLYAPQEYLGFFGFRLSHGSEETALDAPYQVVLTTELAERLFPAQDPIGQEIEWESIGPVMVSGVLAEPEGKTHLRADALVSFPTLETRIADGVDIPLYDWAWNSDIYNYIRLREGGNPGAVEALANEAGVRHHPSTDLEAPSYWLQPLEEINLGRDLSNQIADIMPRGFAGFLSVLALVLVLTAVFNYVNLTVARSVRRTRELGIRKVVGARRGQLVLQLVTEAILTALLALVIAGIGLVWLLPQFNALSAAGGSDSVMQVDSIGSGLIAQFVFLAIGLGLLAGAVPAWRMSMVVPALTVKGRLSVPRRRRFGIRKSLLVVQFTVSMVAIAVTVLLHRQIGFISGSQLGFDEAQVVNVDLQGINPEIVRAELLRVPGVEGVSLISNVPSGGSRTSTDIRTDEMTEPVLITRYAIDDAFLDLYHVRVLAGRSPVEYPEETRDLWLTEAAVDFLGLGTPGDAVGTQLEYDVGPYGGRAVVAGVLSDFYANGVEKGFVPVMLNKTPRLFSTAAVRVQAGSISQAMEHLDVAWQRIAPGTPLEATFFDAQIQESYSDMRSMAGILSTFVVLILFIAGLGLLGMVAYSAESRLREVGVRKVVGAGVWDLVSLLSREYLGLVGLALLVSTPLAWLLTNRLLEQYAEHVPNGLATLLASFSPVIVAAVVIVASQTVRAALTNPVTVLRNE